MSSKDEQDNEQCPVCKSVKYLNPSMVLKMSTCFHMICQNCILRLFPHGTAPCPQCQTVIKRTGFVVPTFKDLVVEKEVRIRKRVFDIFNKRVSDFEEEDPTSAFQRYNDYLEWTEDIVYDLVYNLNVMQREEEIQKERFENQQRIARNRQLANEEESIIPKEVVDIVVHDLVNNEVKVSKQKEWNDWLFNVAPSWTEEGWSDSNIFEGIPKAVHALFDGLWI